ncbi:MAG: hypothetical protein ACREFU_09835 [Acetobacteraceae bacterium]
MAKKWLYFPFDDISKDPTMPGNRKRYEEKYKANLTVVMLGDLLHLVGDDEMFIIAGHGLPGSSEIGITTGPGKTKAHRVLGIDAQSTMTANDLADHLLKAGLPKTHKYIKLISCGSAGMVAVDDKNATIDSSDTKNPKVAAVTVTTHIHEAECLASVLAAALGKRDYNDVLVKGYPGFVNAMNPQKTVSVEGTSEASQVRQMVELVQESGPVTVEMERAQHGVRYWQRGMVGMVRIPAKLLNNYWFDKSGQFRPQNISLKK